MIFTHDSFISTWEFFAEFDYFYAIFHFLHTIMYHFDVIFFPPWFCWFSHVIFTQDSFVFMCEYHLLICSLHVIRVGPNIYVFYQVFTRVHVYNRLLFLSVLIGVTCWTYCSIICHWWNVDCDRSRSSWLTSLCLAHTSWLLFLSEKARGWRN